MLTQRAEEIAIHTFSCSQYAPTDCDNTRHPALDSVDLEWTSALCCHKHNGSSSIAHMGLETPTHPFTSAVSSSSRQPS
eukprot:2883207-Prymnesium_polylepis.1